MPCTSPDFHQKSFRMKHEEDLKFFTRRLTKETSKSNNPSFRVYYGDVPSAVPFMWETRPGTPKHTCSQNPDIPPLTPPPSYYTNNLLNNSSTKNSRSNLLFHALIRTLSPKKSHKVPSSHSSSSSSSLSWSSSSLSSFSDPTPTNKCRRRFSSWGSSFDERNMDYHRREEVCYGIGKRKGDGVRGCYSIFVVKKVLLSIVGRG